MLDQPGLDVDADKARRIPRDEVSLPGADVENPPAGQVLDVERVGAMGERQSSVFKRRSWCLAFGWPIVPQSQNPRWISRNDRARRKRLRHDAAGADDGAFAHVSHDDGLSADPYIGGNDQPLLFAVLQTHRLVKIGETRAGRGRSVWRRDCR